jgi:predicted O-methyltransferase YrrM
VVDCQFPEQGDKHSMFHNIRPAMQARMKELEAIDARDRGDGTPRLQRLRQVPPETGKLIALLAASAPDGAYLEIGASAGYSTLWLALACEAVGRRITTFEILPEKANLARATFAAAQVEPVVELIEGDALAHLERYEQIAFCFLDAEKEIYGACYDLVIPRLVKGGLLVADNAINFRETLQSMLDQADHDERVDALVVPIGHGVLVCRKL